MNLSCPYPYTHVHMGYKSYRLNIVHFNCIAIILHKTIMTIINVTYVYSVHRDAYVRAMPEKRERKTLHDDRSCPKALKRVKEEKRKREKTTSFFSHHHHHNHRRHRLWATRWKSLEEITYFTSIWESIMSVTSLKYIIYLYTYVSVRYNHIIIIIIILVSFLHSFAYSFECKGYTLYNEQTTLDERNLYGWREKEKLHYANEEDNFRMNEWMNEAIRRKRGEKNKNDINSQQTSKRKSHGRCVWMIAKIESESLAAAAVATTSLSSNDMP